LNAEGRKKAKRSYLPTVEALEALRLFSGATATLPDLAAEQAEIAAPMAPAPSTTGAWDAALAGASLADLLGTHAGRPAVDVEATVSGLSQLDRYLGRAWGRAGIAPQLHDDSTQAVYLTLLQNLGRDRFDGLVQDVGQNGIRDVLSRETPEGPDFFRAIDTVKKRAQRQRSFKALDHADAVAAPSRDGPDAPWRAVLHEAISRTLNPRETALIQATLKGETPAEIAQHWGVAPKTVSNEKTRAFQKLRDFLVADLAD